MLYDELTTVEAARLTRTRTVPFGYRLRVEGHGAAWVSPRGELDLASAPLLKQSLHDALEQAALVVVDLRALTFIDCAGIHAVVDADARARGDGHGIVLIHGAGQVGRLFAVTSLSERLRIVDLTQGAPAACSGLESVRMVRNAEQLASRQTARRQAAWIDARPAPNRCPTGPRQWLERRSRAWRRATRHPR